MNMLNPATFAILHTGLAWSSVLAGLASAALWYRAATIKVKNGDLHPVDDLIIGEEAPRTTANLQSQYNQYAAYATAASVALEAFARLFSA